jgi:hypothetical protein
MLVVELAKVSLEIVVLYLEIKLFKLNNPCNLLANCPYINMQPRASQDRQPRYLPIYIVKLKPHVYVPVLPNC